VTIFQMGHLTNVSIQIHSSIPQYDVYKVSLKKNEWKEPFGGVKVDIFWFLLRKWVQLLDFCGF
jgi:hypothetical protein